MTKAEHIELIEICAKLETVTEELERALELTENVFTKNILHKEVEAIHNVIGEILTVGNKKG